MSMRMRSCASMRGVVVGLGHQHAHRAAHLMAGILVDDRIDGAVDQGAARMIGEFMGDDR